MVIALAAGCSSGKGDSAEDLITKAINSGKDLGDFHGEATYEMNYTGGSQILKMEEYKSKDGKMKTVLDNGDNRSIAVIADGKMTVYEADKHAALEKKVSGKNVTTDLNARDQVTNLLKTVGETHTSKLDGEAELHGRKTNHIVVKSNVDEAQIEHMDVWLDQETNIPLKMEATGSGSTVKMEYTKADFAPKFEKDTFKLDLPKDVKVEHFKK